MSQGGAREYVLFPENMPEGKIEHCSDPADSEACGIQRLGLTKQADDPHHSDSATAVTNNFPFHFSFQVIYSVIKLWPLHQNMFVSFLTEHSCLCHCHLPYIAETQHFLFNYIAR